VSTWIAFLRGIGGGIRPMVMKDLQAALEDQLARAAAANPFGQADDEPTSVHVFFLSQRPRQPDLAAMQRLKTRSEAFVPAGRVLYLHTPDGFGVSKLAARIEKLLGVAATARNWRTVNKMLALAAPGHTRAPPAMKRGNETAMKSA
jgi:uncharacterized protein (DUF1697 family)